MFNGKNRTIPYGLLFDLIKFLKDKKYDVKASDEVKQLYGNKQPLDIKYNLKYEPRYYQRDIVKTCLKYKKGIFVSPTASGKSYVIALILDNLIKSNLINQTLIIVPTTNLILQFHGDLIEYGIDESLLGKFFADEKNWDMPILISTWQSLTHDNEKIRKSEIKKLSKELSKKKLKKEDRETFKTRFDLLRSKQYIQNVQDLMQTRQQLLDKVDCFFVDECQVLKSQQVSSLMQKIHNADWRFACTGTLPRSEIDKSNIISFIGPVVKRLTVKQLTDKGYLNPCLIKQYNIFYSKRITGTLNEIKDQLFENLYRQSIINDIVYENKGYNILLLVNRVEMEGMVLEKQLKDEFPGYKIKYIHGKVKPVERDEWRKRCNDEDDVLLIATYSLFSTGINIPNLSRIVLTSSFKSEIRILQSIGRSLRKPDTKKSSIIYDIADQTKFMRSHAKVRMSIYETEEFEVEETDFKEIK